MTGENVIPEKSPEPRGISFLEVMSLFEDKVSASNDTDINQFVTTYIPSDVTIVFSDDEIDDGETAAFYKSKESKGLTQAINGMLIEDTNTEAISQKADLVRDLLRNIPENDIMKESEDADELWSDMDERLQGLKKQIHATQAEIKILTTKDRNLEACDSKIVAIQQQIKEREAVPPKSTVVYEQKLLDLVRDIKDHATSWDEFPFGPAGSWISLKEEFLPWKKLIAERLAPALTEFVVRTEHDRELLSTLMDKHGAPCAVIRGQNDLTSYPTIESPECINILDALNCTNESAKMCLMLTLDYADVVLCESYEKANEISERLGVKEVYYLETEECAGYIKLGVRGKEYGVLGYSGIDKLLAASNDVYPDTEINRLLEQIQETKRNSRQYLRLSYQAHKRREKLKDLEEEKAGLEWRMSEKMESVMNAPDEEIGYFFFLLKAGFTNGLDYQGSPVFKG